MCDAVVVFFVERDSLDVIKDTQQVRLDGVRIGRLSENLEEGGVRDEEETRENQSLLLQVPREGFLAELELLQEVGE